MSPFSTRDGVHFDLCLNVLIIIIECVRQRYNPSSRVKDNDVVRTYFLLQFKIKYLTTLNAGTPTQANRVVFQLRCSGTFDADPGVEGAFELKHDVSSHTAGLIHDLLIACNIIPLFFLRTRCGHSLGLYLYSFRIHLRRTKTYTSQIIKVGK